MSKKFNVTIKQRATAAEKKPRQFDRVAKDIFRLADEAVQLAQAYAGNDSETAATLKQRLEDLGVEATKARAAHKPPFVLITVSGGVASCFCPRGVEWDIIDWDSYETEHPGQEDLKMMRYKARLVKNRTDRRWLLDVIQELEDLGVADEE